MPDAAAAELGPHFSAMQMPIGCYQQAANFPLNQSGSGVSLQTLVDDLYACGFPKLLSFNGSTGLVYDTGSSVTLIVRYLAGICVGAVLVSLLFTVLMAFPVLVSKSVDAPAVLVSRGRGFVTQGGRAAIAKGRQAYQEGKGAVAEAAAKGRQAYQGGKEAVAEALSGGSKTAKAPPAAAGASRPHVEAAAIQAEAAGIPAALVPGRAPESAEPAAPEAAPAPATAVVAAAPSPPAAEETVADVEAGTAGGKRLPSRHFSLLTTSTGGVLYTAYTTWLVLATGLYIAALALLIAGTVQFTDNTVLAWVVNNTSDSGMLYIIEWLVIGALIITGVCDFFAAWIVLAANRPSFKLGRWELRNYLYSSWINRNAYRVHTAVAGFVVLVLTLSMILFGLGLIAVTVQLITQIACSKVADISFQGYSLGDVIPTHRSADDPICAYEALQMCNDITSMGVLTLVLGAVLLLWSHIVWLVLLLLSMWRFRKFQVVSSDSHADMAAATDETDSEAGTDGKKAAAAQVQPRKGWLRLRGLVALGKQGDKAAV
ncbi:hypothetical protein ABPG75_007863 [Micractinium tetrahymenae]